MAAKADSFWQLLMLHGAGNTALSVTYTFEIADDLGVIILAPDSRDEATWDFLLHGFGEDVEFIGAALKTTYARCNIDRTGRGKGHDHLDRPIRIIPLRDRRVA